MTSPRDCAMYPGDLPRTLLVADHSVDAVAVSPTRVRALGRSPDPRSVMETAPVVGEAAPTSLWRELQGEYRHKLPLSTVSTIVELTPILSAVIVAEDRTLWDDK
jgi:hypothetical protein